MFVDNNDNLIIITPSGYAIGSENLVEDDYNSFELWAFVHEMTSEEDQEIRQEAMNRFFDIYCSLYQFIEPFRNCQFLTE